MNKKVEEFLEKYEVFEKERIRLRIEEKDIKNKIDHFDQFAGGEPLLQLHTKYFDVKDEVRKVLNEMTLLCKKNQKLFRVSYAKIKEVLSPRQTKIVLVPTGMAKRKAILKKDTILSNNDVSIDFVKTMEKGGEARLYVANDNGLLKKPVPATFKTSSINSRKFKPVFDYDCGIVLEETGKAPVNKDVEITFTPEKVMELANSMYIYDDNHEKVGVASQKTYQLVNAIIENAKE